MLTTKLLGFSPHLWFVNHTAIKKSVIPTKKINHKLISLILNVSGGLKKHGSEE